ncbi:MAG: hypothetical protein ABIV21_07630 [Pyrinomonadaceae bacterium]
MSDEPKPNNPAAADDDRMPDKWQMPKPVFRTSEGDTPKSVHPDDEADLHETPALETVEVTADEAATEEAEPPTGPVKVKAADPKPTKRGCAFSVVAILTMVIVGVLIVAIALIYLFYSNPTADTFNN